MNKVNFDTIVIGGGIVGISAAEHLTRGGANTLLIDRADPGRATDAGAGIIDDPHSGTPSHDPMSVFQRAAFDYYPTLIEHLHAAQSEDTGFAVCGEMIVAIDADEITHFEALKRYTADLEERILPLDADAARTKFPPLADVHGAVLFRHAARVDGRQLAAALKTSALQNGLTIKNAGVDQLVMRNGRVTGVLADGETIGAGRVIIAGGAWSAQMSVNLPIAPLRGQIIHLHMPDQDTGAWPIVTAFHHHYIVCWPGGRVVVGATREHNAGFAVQPTLAGMLEVMGEALRVAPGLIGAQFLEVRVGLRPVAADGVPVVGTINGVDGVFVATGHGAVGLQLGPFSGKIAADWALGQPSPLDLRPFDPNRFSGKAGP